MNLSTSLMLTIALGLPTALVVLTALVRLLEPRFAFFPMAGESVTPRDFGVDYDSAAVRTRDGEQLCSWSLAGPAARARIVYFHGNGGNLSMWAPVVAGIARHGYSLFAFDYRGYGVSTGRPTEQGMYRDVDASVERFWRDTSGGTPVVYWGRSLGVAMAAYASMVRAPDGLILESGFPDARSLIRTSPVLAFLAVFSTYRFPCSEFLNRLGTPVPVLVVHGDDDHVVSITQGRALFDTIVAPKRFVTVRGGDHNDLAPSDPYTYWEAVSGFIDGLRKTGSVVKGMMKE
jgi:fermentation-respiration switch protein FrsA (DUF1100 family)